MRGFIQSSASIFVMLGMMVEVVSFVLAGIALSNNAGGYGTGLLVAVGGMTAGASIALVGGSTYLLASIDRRLEKLLTNKDGTLLSQTLSPLGGTEKSAEQILAEQV